MPRDFVEFVYPGSFDPFTNGHKDLAIRAAEISDKLDVVILQNASKQAAFTVEERVKMAKLSLAGYDNIHVTSYDGLLVDYLKENNLRIVVRGLRSESDFRYESQIATTNSLMLENYETILLPSRANYSFTSSSTVREVAAYGGDISRMVPEEIIDIVLAKFAK